MRILVWFAAGFGLACLLGAYWLPGPVLFAFGFCALLMSIGGLILFRNPSGKRSAVIFVGGLSVGMLWFLLFTSVSMAPIKAVDGETIDIAAEAMDYSYPTTYGTAVNAKVDLNGRKVSAKLYLNEEVSLAPGDRIGGTFRLCYTGPQGERDSSYYSGYGTFLLCYAKGEADIEFANDQSLRHMPARLRRQISQWVDALFSHDTSGFAKALLLGDTTDLTYQENTALTLSGIVHVVSVSGLHVSILFSLLFRLFGSRRVLTPVLGIGLLAFVAAVTGFSPSIVRACLMNGLMLLALLVNRTYDPPTGLAFAVVVMLGVNPLSVSAVGFQLSVASVMGIQLFAEPITDHISAWNFWSEARQRSFLARFRTWFSGSVAVTLSASIMTAPLTALHFGTVSLVGILTNLLTLWVVNVVFVGIILSVLLAPFWLWGGQKLAWVLSWLIRYVMGSAKLLADFPLSAVYTESIYISLWLVASYCMLICFILVRKQRHFWQFAAASVVLLAVALCASWAEPRLDSCRVTVVDVGQGQCVLLQSDGKTYMVDCGGDYDKDVADRAVAVLRSQGVYRLDGLILTHYDSDHVAAVPYLLYHIQVDTLYLPVGPGADWWDKIESGHEISSVQRVGEDIQIECGGATIDLFVSPFTETTNESSLCVLFQKENCDILITGDRSVSGETYLLLTEQIPVLDVLVAGHHGSDASTGNLLLERTRPDTVVISVGKNNKYGHPADSVLERLEEFGCTVRRTDREGTIVIRR